MKNEEWWKNFGMGMELDVSGAFIYNGIKTLDRIDSLSHPVDIFEILYNLSVGIERLQKIAVILLEHDDDVDIKVLEKSLRKHNTLVLSDRVNKHRALGLSNVHNEFLSILSKFYKSHRYDRYSLSSVPDIDKEKTIFLQYLSKHLDIDLDDTESVFAIPNSNRIKKFVGKIVKKITGGLYNAITDRARELNIYTYELRSDSKAMKVFLEDRLDFIEEDKIRREILLYLMHPSSDGKHIEVIRQFDPLPLEPAFAYAYIKLLVNESPENFVYVAGEVEEQYANGNVDDVGERFELLGVMDDEYLSYEP